MSNLKILRKANFSKGFTLVELLVVIAIIGVLATLILLQLGTARAKARDAKRIADVSQIRTSIELYFDDNGGSYPGAAPLCPDSTTDVCVAAGGTYNGDDLKPYFSAPSLPHDPLDATAYDYNWFPTTASTRRASFRIWADLERPHAAAFAGDADIVAGATWGGPDNTISGVTESLSVCSAANDCIYDLGQN